MKSKIYLSDEGYGHIVRQKAVSESIATLLSNNISFTIQTKNYLQVAKTIFEKGEFIERYNNISWAKLSNGSPDLEKINKYYDKYELISSEYISSNEENINEFDFLISDFVYEVFILGARNNIPSFGIAHFTWDWFFSKLYPPAVKNNLIEYFLKMAQKASRIYFPPFTPKEILNQHKNALNVPLIVRKRGPKKYLINNNFKILIIDSGSGILKTHIKKVLKTINKLDDITFYVPDLYNVNSENIVKIPFNELLIDYIGSVDLVISRAGFNTISECIACRTPMLLLGESMNPEINENIINLKFSGLASFISLEDFNDSLNELLPKFLKNEYKTLKENMNSHEMKTNGAEVIANDILNILF